MRGRKKDTGNVGEKRERENRAGGGERKER